MALADDRDAIRDLLARIVHHGDDGDLTRYAVLLTDDVSWAMPGVEHTGRAAVLDALAARHAEGVSGPRSGTRHILTTTMIDIDGDDAVTRSTWLLVRATPEAPELARFGSYHDRLRRTPDGWRLAARRIEFG